MSNNPPPYEEVASGSSRSPSNEKEPHSPSQFADEQPSTSSQASSAPPPYDTLSIQQPESHLDQPIVEAERHKRAITAYKLKREEEKRKKSEEEKEALGWTGMFFVAVLGLFGA